MATEGLRKHSTTLFHGVLSGQQTRWSGLLPNHSNLTNHQLVMTASEIIDDGTGIYEVYILPDADDVVNPVNTGRVLDLSNNNSAIVNFTGVIRGIILKASTIISQPEVRISAVLSSFSRYKKSSISDNDQERLDYVTSVLTTASASFDNYADVAPNNSNLVYHQLSLIADEPIADAYRLRIIPESDYSLEASVDTGIDLTFDGTASALAYFGGVIAGIELEQLMGGSTNVPVQVVLSSSLERYDEVVYQYIGVEPELGDHITNYNNPHNVTYDQILGDKPLVGYPFVKEVIEVTEDVIVPEDQQYIVWEALHIKGRLEVKGRTIVLHDRPETPPINPDFTYNLGGELTQVDYTGGEQKTFTYNVGGQLTQVDSTKLGTTKRKIFTYTGGGELDYITEQWL